MSESKDRPLIGIAIDSTDLAGRRTNLALAVLLALALVTGVVSFAVGTGWVRPILVLHGVAAVAIVLLVPWKSAIAQRGLRRKREGNVLSTLLAVLVVAALASGVAHSVFNVVSIGPVAIMQVHVGTAVGALVLGVAHVWRHPQRIKVSDLSRRNFLRSGALVAGALFGYFAVEATAGAARLAGAKRRFTGSHERGSCDPAAMPVTSWLTDTPPTLGTVRLLTIITPANIMMGKASIDTSSPLIPLSKQAQTKPTTTAAAAGLGNP